MASKEEVKTYYGRCRCCLEYGYMKSMWKEHMWDEEREIYGEMLMETFNIAWESSSTDEHICETCVGRLRDAFHFKKEVLSADFLLKEEYEDEEEYEVETLNDELLTEDFEYVESVKDDGDDSIYEPEVKTEYGEIEFLEEDAEIVEQSVNTLEKDIDSDIGPTRKRPRMKKKPERSTYRNYTQIDLKMCIETIQKGMSQAEAARLFNIPVKTINTKMISLLGKQDDESDSPEKQVEINKHRDNIRAVLKYTNATVIRAHRGIGYQCYFCPEQFPDPADLKKHSFTHKSLAQNFKICVLFNYTAKIDITGLECKICHSDIDDLSLEDVLLHLKKHDLNVHMGIKNHILPFKFDSGQLKCIICDETFAYFKLLAAHMSEHYQNYICSNCGKGFVNKHARRTHSYKHKTGEFPCRTCEKVFTTQTRRRDHERVVHVLQNKTYKCNYCSDRFIDVVQKTSHEADVHGVERPQFPCTQCGNIYDSQRSLTSHVKRCHLLLRPHKCGYCPKAFFKKSGLQKHYVTHTGEKNYKCASCGKCYGTGSALNKHTKSHMDDASESRDRPFWYDCGTGKLLSPDSKAGEDMQED